VSKKMCSVGSCKKVHYAKGFCTMHYQRWKKTGDARGESPERFFDLEESFRRRTMRNGECLEWIGRVGSDGYGRITVKRKSVLAHRVAWERTNGEIPNGMEIDHQCHNIKCVEVAHLRLATRMQNAWNMSGPNSDSSSGVRNVSRNGAGWAVTVTRDRVTHYFGTYKTVEEAALVAEQARRSLFGEFAGKG